MSMNLAPGTLDGDEAVFISALQKIHAVATAHQLPIMGFGLSPEILQRRMEMGWSAFIIHGDIDAICTSAVQARQLYAEAAAVGKREGRLQLDGDARVERAML